jgi:transcriptional regulator with XRE-family HTH domain
MSEPFNLVRARLNLGLTQRQLAETAGVGLATIQRLERGDGAHPVNAKAVADVFGIQVTDLIPIKPRVVA